MDRNQWRRYSKTVYSIVGEENIYYTASSEKAKEIRKELPDSRAIVIDGTIDHPGNKVCIKMKTGERKIIDRNTLIIIPGGDTTKRIGHPEIKTYVN